MNQLLDSLNIFAPAIVSTLTLEITQRWNNRSRIRSLILQHPPYREKVALCAY